VSGFLSFLLHAFLNAHVFELAGFENLAAFEALDKFGVFVAADNLHARMLARLSWFLRVRERL
jgi:hypothetical protein